MESTSLFGLLLSRTFAVSGTDDPIERYYASMFASYHDQMDSQPGSTAVNAIARGNRTVPRKLLHHYRNTDYPRCPPKLAEDLSALIDCFFWDAVRHNALRHVLETFLMEIPAADAEDLYQILRAADLVQTWTCLTWYALCGDHHGTASY